MADFINTIDRLGDEVVTDSIIDRTIEEFKDDVVNIVGRMAFAYCSALKTVDLPNVRTIMQGSFEKCTSLERVDMLSLKQIQADANNGNAFSGCTNLSEFNAPNVEYIGHQAFGSCKKLSVYNFPKATEISNWAFNGCGIVHAKFPLVTKISDRGFINCNALQIVYLPLCDGDFSSCFQGCNVLEYAILGNPTKLGGNAFLNATKCNLILPNKSKVTQCTNTSAIDSLLAIYVPSALLADYKAATNWVNYTNKIFAIESSEQILSWLGDRYIVDGTIEFSCYTVSNVLSKVTSDNNGSIAGNSYRATLTADRNYILQEVTIAMGGIDVTSQVYNAETGEIIISRVTGDIVIRATAERDPNIVMPILYKLSEPKTFNGTSDYIDTGIKLFDTPKDFTIVCAAQFSALGSNICLFHCMNEATPYPGISVDGNSGVRICYTGSTSLVTSISNKNDVSVIALRFKAGVLDAIRYRNTSGEIVTVNHNISAKYTTTSQNLLLGAYQTTTGEKGRYYKGTIDAFVVYDEYLDDETLAEELSAV